MLRIIEAGESGSLTLKLAGKLAGQWTPELERCWRQAAASLLSRTISLDLTEVTFVDEVGKRLLAAMANAGVELIAADILMKSLVEQIVQGKFIDEDIGLEGTE